MSDVNPSQSSSSSSSSKRPRPAAEKQEESTSKKLKSLVFVEASSVIQPPENELKDPLPENISPPTFWQGAASKFPVLAEMAKAVLAIPATAAPSERVWSAAATSSRPHARCWLTTPSST